MNFAQSTSHMTDNQEYSSKHKWWVSWSNQRTLFISSVWQEYTSNSWE